MPVTPLGFCPPELFPHAKPGHPLGVLCPPAVGRRGAARLQGLGPDVDPLSRTPYSGHAGNRCSPGLSSPPGFSPLPRWSPKQAPPLLGLSTAGSPFRLRIPSRVSLDGRVGLTLSSLPTLLGSSASSSFQPKPESPSGTTPQPLRSTSNEIQSLCCDSFRTTERRAVERFGDEP
jgi:hypothetical protein